MDRYQRQYYLKDFRIRFLESHGDAFQSFFETLMGKVYPNDFIACKPWGKIGDKKNDGYLSSKRILFQVYAPNEIKAADAIKKIDKDFNGAKEHWKKHFDNWIFVHNTIDSRLSPPIIEKLLALQQNNPQIKVGHWGYEELLNEFHKLNIKVLESWFGIAINTQSSVQLGFSELQAVLQHIQTKPLDESSAIREVSQGKIEANLLSTEVAEFLKIGMFKYSIVKDFFMKLRKPKYESQIASAFSDKYISLRDQKPTLHPDLIFSKLEVWAGGTSIKTPKEKAALLAILAYFFDKCIIFEDAGIVQ